MGIEVIGVLDTLFRTGSRLFMIAAAVVLLAPGAAQAKSPMVTKAELQATMQDYIEANSDGGDFLYVDSKTGALNRLSPLAAHPTILATESYYILCADFRAATGERVNVDFFIAKTGKGFLVFEHTVERREQVKRWMKSGVAEKLK